MLIHSYNNEKTADLLRMREKKCNFAENIIQMTQTELLDIAINASLDAGKEIMNVYTDPAQDFGIERKADNSPLTLADKAAHRKIMQYLEPTGIPVLSEEGAQQPYEQRATWQRFWLVDPLDGTKEFIKKNGEFTVNIALIDEGNPIMGVVYLPAKDVLYYGSMQDGAYRKQDGVVERLPLESAKHDDYVIVASRSHLSPETQEFIDDAAKKYDNVRTVSSGSSIKICLVAEGSADAYPRYAPTMEWDTGAGDAVVRAAGRTCVQAGTYDDLPFDDGKLLKYNKKDLHNPWFLVK